MLPVLLYFRTFTRDERAFVSIIKNLSLVWGNARQKVSRIHSRTYVVLSFCSGSSSVVAPFFGRNQQDIGCALALCCTYQPRGWPFLRASLQTNGLSSNRPLGHAGFSTSQKGFA
jgi:hypothetical protein